jgi:uncharacterized protein (TIGR02246 family)
MKLLLPTTFALVVSATSCASIPRAPLSQTELSAIRRLEEAYVSAWVRNDSAAVMATLSSDAVIMPGRLPPIAGLAAIRAFSFPPGPPTTVISYRTEIVELDGVGDLAYVRGHGDLTFAFTGPGGVRTERRNRSVFLMIARREPDGTWRIARRMWSDMAP